MDLHKGVFLDLGTVDNGDLDRSRLQETLPAWHWHDFTNAGDVAARIKDANVIFSNRCVLDRFLLESAAGLKLVALAATGTDKVDLEAARALGITVCNLRDYCSAAVAQHVVTLMLNLLTGQPWYWQSVRQGGWIDEQQFSLNGRPIRQANGLSLGIVGYGALGQATANLSEALGMKVLVSDRKGANPRPGRVRFEEVLRRSDVLSIHCPLTQDTRNLIGAREIRTMKRDAILINTARGGIVDEQSLADCLRQGVIAGAGIDTLSEEPPATDHPLLAPDIPNLMVTPHNAWASRSARQAALDQLADIVRSCKAGQPINRVA